MQLLVQHARRERRPSMTDDFITKAMQLAETLASHAYRGGEAGKDFFDETDHARATLLAHLEGGRLPDRSQMTIELARTRFEYKPETGELLWRNCRIKKLNGKQAGAVRQDGYLQVNVRGRLYFVHRIIFLLVTGEEPIEVDHINGVRADNRWSNLRPVSRGENSLNKKLHKNNKSGVKGVFWSEANQKWRAVVKLGGRPVYAKMFKEFDDAAKAVAEARRSFHGEFSRGSSAGALAQSDALKGE